MAGWRSALDGQFALLERIPPFQRVIATERTPGGPEVGVSAGREQERRRCTALVTERRGELEVSPSSEGLTGGSSGGSSGGGDGENQNSSNVTSSTVMSVWPHVVEALAASIFPGDYVERSRGSGADTPALNAFDAEFGDSIRITLSTAGDRRPVARYPQPDPDMDAARWNAVATRNQRIEISINPQ